MDNNGGIVETMYSVTGDDEIYPPCISSDLDKDGYLDIIFLKKSQDDYYLGKLEDDTYQEIFLGEYIHEGTDEELRESIFSISDFAISDMNNDGVNEIIASFCGDEKGIHIINNEMSTQFISIPNFYNKNIVIGDFDDDNNIDIACMTRDGSKKYIEIYDNSYAKTDSVPFIGQCECNSLWLSNIDLQDPSLELVYNVGDDLYVIDFPSSGTNIGWKGYSCNYRNSGVYEQPAYYAPEGDTVYWANTISLSDTFEIPVNNTVIIKQGTIVKAHSNGKLIVSGELIAEGSDNHPIQFIPDIYVSPDEYWQGIEIASSSAITLQYCEISYAYKGLTFQTSSTGTVTNCSIHDCNVGLELLRNENPPCFTGNTLWQNDLGVHIFVSEATLDSNSIRENNRGILVEQGFRYELIGNNVDYNNTCGIHLVQSSDGFLDGNIITGNGLSPEPDAMVIGGIFLHASSPVLINNVINLNLNHGIIAMNGSQPVMNLNGSALNHIEENGLSDPCIPHCEPESAEMILFDRSFPLLAIGHNDIFDNQGGYLIYGYRINPVPMFIDITYNYWADEDPGLGERFYPDIFDYFPYDTEPNTGGGTSGADWTDNQLLYQQGLTYEEEGNFDPAIQTYKTLIATFPDSMEALGSVPRLFVCTQQIGGNFQVLQEYYDSLTVEYAETPLSKVADQYSILTHLPVEEYSTAIEKYEEILSNPQSLDDSVYAVINIGQVYLAADSNGQGGLGRSQTLGTKSEYRPINRADYDDKVNSALAILMGQGKSTKVSQIPESYALHQNYPNPFNPITTIRYDLPEDSHVFIKIYDILGREVRTLINSEQTAGYKSVQWDGKDVFGNTSGSGLYIYRISASDFNSSKKMLILR